MNGVSRGICRIIIIALCLVAAASYSFYEAEDFLLSREPRSLVKLFESRKPGENHNIEIVGARDYLPAAVRKKWLAQIVVKKLGVLLTPRFYQTSYLSAFLVGG